MIRWFYPRNGGRGRAGWVVAISYFTTRPFGVNRVTCTLYLDCDKMVVMVQKPLSKSSQRRVNSILENLADAKKTLAAVDAKEITDLVRRVAIPIARDSYPANVLGDATSGGGISDPTGGTAAGNVDREAAGTDWLTRQLKQLERDAKRVAKDLLDIEGILSTEARGIEKKKERPTSVPCSICQELPAEVAGWCRPDYNDWHKHGKPDRQRWELFKRQDKSTDGETLVAECPPPADGNSAIRGPWRIING